MFSDNFKEYTDRKYAERLPFLGACKDEAEGKMAVLGEDERLLMKFFYGTMPLSDAGEYKFETFLGFVKHSLMLLETKDWCKELPEDIFLHHVLYYRINSERIEDCRGFFYDQLKDRICGMSARKAAASINYWCAENGIYEPSDRRTESPLTFYYSGRGRCGEESTFAVTAFRSVGIPARQVYTPGWAHCDDNHAWVEVYVDGGWHFLGACEPEEVLDKGWFSNASSRAILVHTRTFSDYSCGNCDCSWKDKGLYFHNETKTYARTKDYVIKVMYADGTPAKGAKISVGILNGSEFVSVAMLTAGKDGIAVINSGLGDIFLRAYKDGAYAGARADVKNTDGTEMILNTCCIPYQKDYSKEVWTDINVTAPDEYDMHTVKLSGEQRRANLKKLKECRAMREERISGYYRQEYGSSFPAEEEIFKMAAGNAENIYSFLKAGDEPDRRAILHTLLPKDYRDVTQQVLESHLANASRFASEWKESGLGEIYEKYILCPRVSFEELTAYPDAVNDYFDEEKKAWFKLDPSFAWEWINENIGYEPELDYDTIVSTPAGTLKLSACNPESKKILFVAICRSLGIPARINRVNSDAEYYDKKKGVFVPAGAAGREDPAPSGTVRLVSDAPEHWIYHRNWTIAELDGERFKTLNYYGAVFSEKGYELRLRPGSYRLTTSSRLPNGNQLASIYHFTLREGSERIIEMRIRRGSLTDLLISEELDDFSVMKDSIPVYASSEAGEAPCIFAFLAEGEEPTEHVLNEMLEEADAWLKADLKIFFIVRSAEALKNPALAKVIDAIPKIIVFYGDPDDIAEPAARRMYADTGKLPLLILTDKGLHGIYACSGYNTGSADLILKLNGISRDN